MKRIIALLLSAVLFSGLCGCSQQVSTVETEPTATVEETNPEAAVEETESEEPIAETMEVSEQEHWDVTAVYADSEAYENELQKVQDELIPALSEYRGQLNTEQNIISFCNQNDIVAQKLRQLNAYATLLTEQNQADSEATAIMQEVNKAMDQYSEETAFVDSELLANSDDFLNQLMENEQMEPFVTQIERLRDNASHVLSDESEVLLFPLSNAANGASTLFSKLTAADMQFNTVTDLDGQEIVVDESTYSMVLTSNPDSAFRKTCSESLLSAYAQYRNTLAQNMDNYVQATVSLAHSHNFATAKEEAMAASTVPTEVYDNLIEAVNNNLDTAHRYYALRKEIMGVDTLYTSDIYYPLVDDIEASFSYEEAQELILAALAPLGEDYQSNLKKAFEERWIDVYPSDGKSNGAWSMGLNGVHPYVLLNFTGDYNSVSTLAHELGHAMHQYESAQTQNSDYNSDPTSFTSEVASTTNELLLADYMINNAKTDNEKLYYLFSELNTLNNTFFVQAMFSEFEDAMYQIVENGGSLNADNLEALWLQTLEKYDGSDCTLTDGAQYGWSRIPHFYYDYYVYQYATSISGACTVSEKIESGDVGAIEDYLEFLKSGDSDDGVSLLSIAGVDVTSPTLADALIVRYNNLVDQIEEVANTK